MYVRQTWDVSRFINADVPQEDWDTSQFIEEPSTATHYLQKLSPFGTPRDQNTTMTNEIPMARFWNEFNEFYTAFIDDIDFYYAKPTRERQAQAAKEYDSLTPSVKRVRDQLTKYGG